MLNYLSSWLHNKYDHEINFPYAYFNSVDFNKSWAFGSIISN